MTTLEFAKKNNYNLIDGKLINTNLFPYQEDLLNDMDNENKLAILHSRQMGITKMITLYIANFLLNNTNKSKFIIHLISNKLYSSQNIINDVRFIINKFNQKSNIFEINSQRCIQLKNGNEVRTISSLSSINSFDFNSLDSLIIDNASFKEDLHSIIDEYSFHNTKLIIASGKKIGACYFYDEIINSIDKTFKCVQISWNKHPNRDNKWLERIKNSIGDNNQFLSEFELIDVPYETKPNKNKILNIRVSDDLIAKISRKLIEKDLSLSDYIRGLIERDTQ